MAVSLQSSCDAAPCLMPLCLAMATGSSDVGRGAAAALEHQASCSAHPPGCLHPVSRGVLAPWPATTNRPSIPGDNRRRCASRLDLDAIPGPWKYAWPVLGNMPHGLARHDFHRQVKSTLPQAGPLHTSPGGSRVSITARPFFLHPSSPQARSHLSPPLPPPANQPNRPGSCSSGPTSTAGSTAPSCCGTMGSWCPTPPPLRRSVVEGRAPWTRWRSSTVPSTR